MRAFISYSINDKDQFILTLLSSELIKKGYEISQSVDFQKEEISSLTKINISKSELFIGIITGNGFEQKRIMHEWRRAQVGRVPAILLVENTVPISDKFKFAYVVFNRKKPQQAIENLKLVLNKHEEKKQKDTKALNFVLGSAALLLVLSLLDD
ncbi:MAG: hypothetical protein RLZZ424_526 [Bacteroidota bacterium]|jgi:hypothetical protein